VLEFVSQQQADPLSQTPLQSESDEQVVLGGGLFRPCVPVVSLPEFPEPPVLASVSSAGVWVFGALKAPLSVPELLDPPHALRRAMTLAYPAKTVMRSDRGCMVSPSLRASERGTRRHYRQRFGPFRTRSLAHSGLKPS
jgi:hypothetical protein